MTDSELDAILKEIEKKATDKSTVDTPHSEEKTEPAISKPENDNPVQELPKQEPAEDNLLTLEEVKEISQEKPVVSDTFEGFEAGIADEPEYEEDDISDFEKKSDGKNKKVIVAVVAIVAIIAIAVGVYFGFFYNKAEEPQPTSSEPQTTQQAPVVTDKGAMNPLTGEYGYNEAAVGKRPVAVVVENEYSTESVRPQWAINEADIVLEGESEFSTRLLLFFADYTNIPEKVGPARSARPPFIRFSQLFDSVFIHAGLSHSKGDYVGADTVFESNNVDHYNLLSGSEDGGLFGRDKSRTSTIEHTGYLNGKGVALLFEKKNWRTDIKQSQFTALSFNEEATEIGTTPATSIEFKWSGSCPKTGHFSYDEDKKAYTTTDFDSRYGEANLELTNLVFLLDQTEYIVKSNYKNSGSSETYCNYKLSGGKGVVASMGTQIDITWGVENGKLWMKDANGNAVTLNPGKTYIGYGSSNKGGAITNKTSAN